MMGFFSQSLARENVSRCKPTMNTIVVCFQGTRIKNTHFLTLVILLMEEILHQLIGSLSHYLQILQGFVDLRWWFGISSINSSLLPVISKGFAALHRIVLVALNKNQMFALHAQLQRVRSNTVPPLKMAKFGQSVLDYAEILKTKPRSRGCLYRRFL